MTLDRTIYRKCRYTDSDSIRIVVVYDTRAACHDVQRCESYEARIYSSKNKKRQDRITNILFYMKLVNYWVISLTPDTRDHSGSFPDSSRLNGFLFSHIPHSIPTEANTQPYAPITIQVIIYNSDYTLFLSIHTEKRARSPQTGGNPLYKKYLAICSHI